MEWVWRADPSVLAGLALAAALYGWAARAWRRLGGDAPPTPGQVMAWALALLTLWLALESPLDEIADNALFSAHMLQHLLLVLVVPPLALAGLPGWMARPILGRAGVRRVAAFAARPLIAFALFNAVFSLAHVPAVYDWVQRSETVHALEHLIFLATGVLLWLPVLSPLPELPRLSRPLQLGYLFLQTLPCGIVGAMITLAGGPLYATYAGGAPAFGLTPEQDQQIGGLLMWIGGTLYYFLAMAVVFFAWAGESEDDRAAPRAGSRVGTLKGV
jgi:putative membrane protein